MKVSFPASISRIAAIIGALFSFTASAPIDPASENALNPTMNWPAWFGPDYTNKAARSYQELVDNLANAKVVWKSSEKLGVGKICSSGDYACTYISCGYASPVVSKGKVYLFYYTPSGTAIDVTKPTIVDPELGNKYAILADDIIHCWDAQTGKTLWKKVFSRKGMNWNGGFKSGPQLTCCVWNDRVYAMGTTGRLYCLDANTGDSLWESHISRRFYMMQKAVESSLKSGTLTFGGNRDFLSSSVVIDGVLINNTHTMSKGNDWYKDTTTGLIAHDAMTGDSLWMNYNTMGIKITPVKWCWKGKEYLISANDGYQGPRLVRCIDPRTGRELWTAPGGGEISNPMVYEDYLICTIDTLIAGNLSALTGCYKITPEGATRLWVMQAGDDQIAFDNGYAYILDAEASILCVNIATGAVVKRVDGLSASEGQAFIAIADGRLIYGNGRDQMNIFMYNSDPSSLAKMPGAIMVDRAMGYGTPIMPAIADGRMFMRTLTQGLWCYDLRKTPRNVSTVPDGRSVDKERRTLRPVIDNKAAAPRFDILGRPLEAGAPPRRSMGITLSAINGAIAVIVVRP